jgi:hypothetical protein
MQRRSFGRAVNNWLSEPKGEIFRDGKWRFWWPTLIGLTALNAVMTAVIFGQGATQKYIGSIVILAGAVLCWLGLGLLHYSDSEDRLLAIGVAALDSITLLFVAGHFSFLLWAQGHLWNLRAAESQFRQDMATYNQQWAPVKDSNERIAATVERVAQIEKQTERLKSDTAYWNRRNGVKQGPASGLTFNAQLTPVEVPPPPKPPAESSSDFLSKWDWWIRFTGFGELALSIVTLIFVRTRTAARNRIMAPEIEDDFPDSIEVENRLPIKREKFSPKKEPTKNHGSFNSEGLERLRAALRDISFRLAGFSFKSNVKDDCVWIFLMKANAGTQETVSSAKAKLDILTDALTMPREAFRTRLENFLRENGFEI